MNEKVIKSDFFSLSFLFPKIIPLPTQRNSQPGLILINAPIKEGSLRARVFLESLQATRKQQHG